MIMTQYGFYVDSSRCIGCKTCQVSCKDAKDLAVGPKLRRVYEYGGGEWWKNGHHWSHSTFIYYLSIACNYCDEPTCVAGCPTGAMYKRKQDGLVVVDQSICIGCRYCAMRCPYSAPQFDNIKQVMAKCDGCYQRVDQGLQSICVESCPQRALEFGDIRQLRAKYGGECQTAPLPPAHFTKPNLIIKPHPHSLESDDRSGAILNPQEV